MSEYIVNVPDEEAEYFIARFGFENVKLTGYSLTGEIVRCKDCKHFCEDRRDTSIGWVSVFVCNSEQWSTASLMPSHKVKPDGFCAWAKRKEGGDE